jgi:hypothetical protein
MNRFLSYFPNKKARRAEALQAFEPNLCDKSHNYILLDKTLELVHEAETEPAGV